MKVECLEGAEEQITQAGLASCSTQMIPAGTLIMVVRSGILKHTIPVAMSAVPIALNQDLKAFRFDEETCDARFLFRWVQGFNDALLHAWGKQGATVESLEMGYLLKSVIPLPPLAEQRSIIDFLDREIATIDALIAEQERLISLLQEKRQAVISHLVTKGLDPNVPMKDSGVEWIGTAPAHWTFPPVVDRYFVELGKMLDEKRVTGAHLTPYLRNINVQWDSVGTDDLPEMDIAPHEAERYLVREGDLLVCEGGEVGRAAIWDGRISTCGYQKALHRLRARRNTEVPRFMLYTLRHAATMGVFTANGNQNTIPHLTAQQLRRYRFPVPPVAEQKRIVEHVDRSTEALGLAESAAQEAISLLIERRTALITAAVTGQIDVRGPVETAA